METITKQDAQKWANALRSGEYKQTQGALQDERGFCCLGVACKIFIPEGEQVTYRGFLSGGVPSIQDNAPEWLDGINYYTNKLLGRGLTELNDLEALTFDEIADVIELVYVHKALN
jgi:uncharacterized membrane-anchored protein